MWRAHWIHSVTIPTEIIGAAEVSNLESGIMKRVCETLAILVFVIGDDLSPPGQPSLCHGDGDGGFKEPKQTSKT